MGFNSALTLVAIAGLGYYVWKLGKVPPQEVTSPQQPELAGLRSTNKLGLDFDTAIANLRDNLTVGGLVFATPEASVNPYEVGANIQRGLTGGQTFGELFNNFFGGVNR